MAPQAHPGRDRRTQSDWARPRLGQPRSLEAGPSAARSSAAATIRRSGGRSACAERLYRAPAMPAAPLPTALELGRLIAAGDADPVALAEEALERAGGAPARNAFIALTPSERATRPPPARAGTPWAPAWPARRRPDGLEGPLRRARHADDGWLGDAPRRAAGGGRRAGRGEPGRRRPGLHRQDQPDRAGLLRARAQPALRYAAQPVRRRGRPHPRRVVVGLGGRGRGGRRAVRDRHRHLGLGAGARRVLRAGGFKPTSAASTAGAWWHSRRRSTASGRSPTRSPTSSRSTRRCAGSRHACRRRHRRTALGSSFPTACSSTTSPRASAPASVPRSRRWRAPGKGRAPAGGRPGPRAGAARRPWHDRRRRGLARARRPRRRAAAGALDPRVLTRIRNGRGVVGRDYDALLAERAPLQRRLARSSAARSAILPTVRHTAPSSRRSSATPSCSPT